MFKVKIPKRFTIPVTLSRASGGVWIDGKWVETVSPNIKIDVSWQALTPSDYRLLPEGESPLGAFKAFWNGTFVTGVDGQYRSDHLIVNSITYKLVAILNWTSGGYTAALFTELKP